MATKVLTNCKLWVDAYDLSGDVNSLGLDYGAELPDATTFADTTRKRKGGLKTLGFAHEGFVNLGPGLADEVLFNRIGVKNTLMTVAPVAGLDGEIAYLARVIAGEYTPRGAVGEMFGFGLAGEASDLLVRGTILKNGVVTVTGQGTAFNLGAINAGQGLYAGLHVVSAAGTSVTVTLESDDASGFASPTVRLPFPAATAIGGKYEATIPGAISDTWWRAEWTVVGTSFGIVVVMGIM